jgi:hypothetical protein
MTEGNAVRHLGYRHHSAWWSGTTNRQATRQRPYDHSLEELQRDVDEWTARYNAEHTHSGKYCYGKTPLQTIIGSAKLARARPTEPPRPTEPGDASMRVNELGASRPSADRTGATFRRIS